MTDMQHTMFLAGMAARLSIYLAGATVGLAIASMIGCSIEHVLHVGADCWDTKALVIALAFAMLADEVAKRLLLGEGGPT